MTLNPNANLPKRGTAAQWTSANPVLGAGEIGWETDTGYTKRGDGTTPWSSLLYREGFLQAYTPEKFGAPKVYSGTYDDTSAVQSAITASIADGIPLLLRRRYNIDGTLTANGLIAVRGFGKFNPNDPGGTMKSGLIAQQGTADLLVINGDGSTLRDFSIHNAVTTDPTAGSGVKLSHAWGSSVTGLAISNFYNLIESDNVCYANISDCHLYDPVQYGMFLNGVSTPNGDMGEHNIIGNHILTWNHDRTVAAAIRWEAGGGYKSLGNKINGQAADGSTVPHQGVFQVGLDVAAADGISTGEIKTIGDTFSVCTVAGIRVRQKGPSNTGTVTEIIIDDDIILGWGSSAVGIDISATSANDIRTVNIGDDNIITGCKAGGVKIGYCRSVKSGRWSYNAASPITGPFLAIGDSTTVNPYPVAVRAVMPIAGYDGTTGNPLDAVDVITDHRSYGNNRVLSGRIEMDDRRGFDLSSASGTPVTVAEQCWILDIYDNRKTGGGIAEIYVEGTNLAGEFVIRQIRSITSHPGVAATVTTVGTDVAAGPGAAHVTVTYDTTTQGSVKIGIQADNVQSGYDTRGFAEINAVGGFTRFHKGA